jgi:hypothetical protein
MMLWSFNGFKQDLKIGLSPAAGYFAIAVFFSNIHTCINGSQISDQFDLDPPPLHTYLRLPPAQNINPEPRHAPRVPPLLRE